MVPRVLFERFEGVLRVQGSKSSRFQGFYKSGVPIVQVRGVPNPSNL